MKKLTIEDYQKYITLTKFVIKETERRYKLIEKQKKVSELSYEDWVKYQTGKFKI